MKTHIHKILRRHCTWLLLALLLCGIMLVALSNARADANAYSPIFPVSQNR